MRHPILRYLLATLGALVFAASSISAQEPAASPPPHPKAEANRQQTVDDNLRRIGLNNQSIVDVVKAGQTTSEIAVLAPFILPVLIVWIMAFVRNRRTQALHATLRLMVEKGVAIPPELLVAPPQAPSDFRRGVLLIGLGVGFIVLLAMLAHKGWWSIGLVPLLLGVGYLVVAKLGTKPPAGPGPTLPA